MSVTASLERPRSAVALWGRLAAWVFSAARPRPRRGGDAPAEPSRHDIGLDRLHQDYAPRGRGGQVSLRQLHARAERLAAGLPD